MHAIPTSSWKCATAWTSSARFTSSSRPRGYLRQELKRVKQGEQIALGTATDPYQPAEKRFEITRGILEEIAVHRGLESGIVTKSDLIVRDVELLRRVAEHNRLYINLTITTLNTKLARILEPRAPRPDLRLQAVAKLVEAGLNAGVICSPVFRGSPIRLPRSTSWCAPPKRPEGNISTRIPFS